MGLLKSIGDFLFGKSPDIFDDTGRVTHKHPDSKWRAWDESYSNNPEFDWRKHSAHSENKSSKVIK